MKAKNTDTNLRSKRSILLEKYLDGSVAQDIYETSGDDIIGDAYEYFMMKFAQESGKSKEQLQEAVVDAMNTVLEYSDDVKHFGREYPGGDLSR